MLARVATGENVRKWNLREKKKGRKQSSLKERGHVGGIGRALIFHEEEKTRHLKKRVAF